MKDLTSDSVRDTKYLIDNTAMPPDMQFSTIVINLGGAARKIVLNLLPSEQTPHHAFAELKAQFRWRETLGHLLRATETGKRITKYICGRIGGNTTHRGGANEQQHADAAIYAWCPGWKNHQLPCFNEAQRHVFQRVAGRTSTNRTRTTNYSYSTS